MNLRNWLFDRNVLKQRSFDVPVICVGNLTVGGTGKTPHIEYLIRLLSKQYKVAVLSRGYKRKSKGFKVVEMDSRVQDVGDEPLQIKRKFPGTMVFVDGNRVRAIEKILSAERASHPDVILLDEPASALDPISTLKIEELLRELESEYTIVIVTHNMQQAARVSDKTVFYSLNEQRQGVLVEHGPTRKMFTNPDDPRTEGYISGRFG